MLIRTFLCLFTCCLTALSLVASTTHATPVEAAAGELARFVPIEVRVDPPHALIRLEVTPQGDRRRVTQWELDALSWRHLKELEDRGVRHLRFEGRFSDKSGPWRPIESLLRPLKAPAPRPYEPPRADSGTAAALVGEPVAGGVSGALSGKFIYLSPGHGWYWSDVLKRWATQRGNTHDIVEDFVNMEGAMHYLVPLLRNAGATVVGVRELDINTWMGLVDDGDAAGFETSGEWLKAGGAGFAAGQAPYKGSVNPHALGGVTTAAVASQSTAVARWTVEVPKPGVYNVYISYTAGEDRAQDAHYVLKSGGNERHFRVDQRRHGQTWVTLSQLFLHGSTVVELHNDTEGPLDRLVVADAVRVGGGVGEMVRGTGAPPTKGPTSGRPRWEECSRYYAQYAGAPPTVWNVSSGDSKDDVSTRARLAAWHHETGEDAMYVSWHSNAGSTTARGTSTYVYGPNPVNGSKNYQGTKGSTELGKALQKHIVADLRATWEPDWKDRGLYSAYFGEVNPKSNPEMPSALIESAFHSTKADADSLRAPRFRFLLSRAVRKAIIHYFAERDGIAVKLPPSAPRALQLDSDGSLSWEPGPFGDVEGHAATSYLVQTSINGRHFNDGVEIQGTAINLVMPEGNLPLFARVVAVNQGGVSFPSAVVGASAGCDGEAEVLVVDGFTRLGPEQLQDDLSPFAYTVDRLRQRRMTPSTTPSSTSPRWRRLATPSPRCSAARGSPAPSPMRPLGCIGQLVSRV